MGGDPWTCDFTPGSLFLALCYAVIGVTLWLYFFKQVRANRHRAPQKVFHVILSTQCLCRVAFFGLWPFIGDTCSPTVDGHGWLERTVGTLPANMFYSAMSVLVWTFARIYHSVLRQSSGEFVRYIGLCSFLALLNVVVYSSQIIGWYVDELQGFAVVAFEISSLIIALLFLLYGWLCFSHVRAVLVRVEQHSTITSATGKSVVVTGNSDDDDDDDFASVSLTNEQETISDQGSLNSPLMEGSASKKHNLTKQSNKKTKSQNNPMKKIVILASICTGCFLLRGAVLVVMASEFSAEIWPILIPYYLVAEVVPSALLLLAFEHGAESTHELPKTAVGANPDTEASTITTMNPAPPLWAGGASKYETDT